MVKKYYLFLYYAFFLTVTFTLKVNAQIDPQFSQYMFINPYVNPGAVGINNRTDLALLYRYQWAGNRPSIGSSSDLSGSPRTLLFNASTKVQLISSGIGGYIFKDDLGPISNLNAKINYAYHIRLAGGRLGLGVGLGILNTSIDFSKLRAIDQDDPRLQYLQNNANSGILPDINAGVFYYKEEYYVGLSASHLNAPVYLPKNPIDPFGNSSSIGRVYYLTGGYNFKLNDLFVLSPSFLVKSSVQKFSTTSVDISTLLKYNNDQFFGGLAFRSGDALTAIIGVGLLGDNALRLGYAFDLTLIGNSAKAFTSHELMITYSKPVAELLPKPVIRTPRYRF